MRPIGVAMRISPRIIGWAGDRHLEFELFVVGLEFVVTDGPVHPNTVACVDLEVGGMETRRERGPVHGTSTDAFAAVVSSERQWIVAAGNAGFRPVEVV
jgi:hypothetical protein